MACSKLNIQKFLHKSQQLFTATAVSEATKSKQLNHYIIVFTVVTIFYLPLSFVAVSSDPHVPFMRPTLEHVLTLGNLRRSMH